MKKSLKRPLKKTGSFQAALRKYPERSPSVFRRFLVFGYIKPEKKTVFRA